MKDAHRWATRIALFGLILFIIGNEIDNPAFRQLLEITAGVLAVLGLAIDVLPPRKE